MDIERIAAQYRKPHGIKGRRLSKKMEEKNAPAYKWILPRLETNGAVKILEIGYGPGTCLHALAGMNPRCRFFGIDFSRVMYRRAQSKNRKYIRQGRMTLAMGDILDYDDEYDFDLVFCVNVIYFWNDLPYYFAKLLELLKAGGTLQIYMASEERLAHVEHARSDVFKKYSVDYVKDGLGRARFENIEAVTYDTGLGPAYLVGAVKPGS